jgi:hypothetical protein
MKGDSMIKKRIAIVEDKFVPFPFNNTANLFGIWIEIKEWKEYRISKEGTTTILVTHIMPSSNNRAYIQGVSSTGLFINEWVSNTASVRKLTSKEVNSIIKMDLTSKYPRLIDNLPLAGCSIGTDPEVFVMGDKGVIPAFKFLPDKNIVEKNQPFWDGFQAEFTCYPSSRGNKTCIAYTVDEIQSGLNKLYNLALTYDKHAQINPVTVVDLNMESFRGEDPKFFELGCAPSQNAYNLPSLNVPDPTILPMRFAGCHMHFGVTDVLKSNTSSRLTNIVKTIDALFGVASVALLRGMEDPRRRLFYGKAGEYRTPDWGLEYRVPSSAILAHPTLTHIAFELARAAMYIGCYFDRDSILCGVTDDKVVDIINNYDVGGALKLLSSNWRIIRQSLRRRLSFDRISHIENAIKYGINSVLKISDMKTNWQLAKNNRWLGHCQSPDCCIANTIFSSPPSIITNTKEAVWN